MSGVEQQPCCCAPKLHPCCATYEDIEECISGGEPICDSGGGGGGFGAGQNGGGGGGFTGNTVTEFVIQKTKSGCFETEEACIAEYADLNNAVIAFYEDIDCVGTSLPPPEQLPENFCTVPCFKVCAYYECGQCGRYVHYCEKVPCSTVCPEPPTNCPEDPCCEPPPPRFCCCVTVDEQGCTIQEFTTCTALAPGTDCPNPPPNTYCTEVASCDECIQANCTTGIILTCVSQCPDSCWCDGGGPGCPNGPPPACCDPAAFQCAGGCCTADCGACFNNFSCNIGPCRIKTMGTCIICGQSGSPFGAQQSASEYDLTKGYILDKNQQIGFNNLFLFGYGENFL